MSDSIGFSQGSLYRNDGSGIPRQFVFAIGELHYDFGTEARRDSFIQQNNPNNPGEIDSPKIMARCFKPVTEGGKGLGHEAAALIWTLQIDGRPAYAIRPQGEFSSNEYAKILELFAGSYPDSDDTPKKVERVAIAGTISGSTRLFNGTVVPTIHPTARGMYGWSTVQLLQAVENIADAQQSDATGQGISAPTKANVAHFLIRVYGELRNPGLAPQDRALNYAATNAFQLGEIFSQAVKNNMALDQIQVERTPIQRPGSDCWDVKFSFFDPTKITEKVRRHFRITADVSDEVPATIGGVRSWFSYF